MHVMTVSKYRYIIVLKKITILGETNSNGPLYYLYLYHSPFFTLLLSNSAELVSFCRADFQQLFCSFLLILPRKTDSFQSITFKYFNLSQIGFSKLLMQVITGGSITVL